MSDEKERENSLDNDVLASASSIEISDEEVERYDSIKDKDDSWKKVKRPPKWSLKRAVLMGVVIVGIPWYMWGKFDDIAYFLSSSEPIDLGGASDYVHDGHDTAKVQSFADNKYVTMHGYPMRQITVKTKSRGSDLKLVYQLMGSSVYVEEGVEGSKYAEFINSTTSAFSADSAGVSDVVVSGRLRRFDAGEGELYAPIRNYYTSNYDVTFCNDLSENEKLRRRSLLGRGGLTLQVMPDGTAISGDTGSATTIRKVIPLRGRSALAIGDGNLRFTTKDAGLTWQNNRLPYSGQVTSVAYDKNSGAIIYASRGGRVGPEDNVGDGEFMKTSQDVEDMIFNDPANLIVDSDNDLISKLAPAMIAVGREGLLQLAWSNREDWLPAAINMGQDYHDTALVDGTVYVVGNNGELMTHSDKFDKPEVWERAISPVAEDWHSLLVMQDWLVVTGSHGKVIRQKRGDTTHTWEVWPFDDVPGIEIQSTLRSSALSGDGNTWVGVGDNGMIMLANRSSDGEFGRIRAISGSFKGYGFVDDMIADVAPSDMIANLIARTTKSDIYGVTWHKGRFFAVGQNGLFMTSPDGHTWVKQTIGFGDKSLRTIAFVNEDTGYIGGEAGTLLVTKDGGKTWNSVNSPSKRSIYKIVTDPNLKDAFVYSGTFGLWGYCYTKDNRCFLRSHNQDDHYYAVTLLKKPESASKLTILAVGEHGRVDMIEDGRADKQVKTLLRSVVSNVNDIPFSMALADETLPFRPGYGLNKNGLGQVGLIGVQNGIVYRSTDGGYTYSPQATGLHGDIQKVMLSTDGDAAYAISVDGKVSRLLHGVYAWEIVATSPEQKMVDGVVLKQKAVLADSRCLYTLGMQPGDALVERACFDAPIKSVTRLGASQVAVLAGASVYSLDVDSTESPNLMASSLPIAVSPNGVIAQEANSGARVIGCGNDVWLSDEGHIYSVSSGEWKEMQISTGDLLDVVCVDKQFTIISSTQPKMGVWHIEATKYSDAGAEVVWGINVGFDPVHARVVHTKDGFWSLAAQSPNAKMPIILLSRDGKKWSWRRDRSTDLYAVAQGLGVTAAVGDGGTLLLSKNLGLTWQKVQTPTENTLRDVCISKDGSFGIAVGDAGTVLRTKKSIDSWSRAGFDLKTNLTSCTIDETDGRFNVYIAGKDGLFYVAKDKSLERLEIIVSSSFENIEALTTLQTGEVLAVGGNYQNPESVCEDGFIIIDGERPIDMWYKVLFYLALIAFWCFTVYKFRQAFIHRNDIPEMDLLFTPDNTKAPEETKRDSSARAVVETAEDLPKSEEEADDWADEDLPEDDGAELDESAEAESLESADDELVEFKEE